MSFRKKMLKFMSRFSQPLGLMLLGFLTLI